MTKIIIKKLKKTGSSLKSSQLWGWLILISLFSLMPFVTMDSRLETSSSRNKLIFDRDNRQKHEYDNGKQLVITNHWNGNIVYAGNVENVPNHMENFAGIVTNFLMQLGIDGQSRLTEFNRLLLESEQPLLDNQANQDAFANVNAMVAPNGALRMPQTAQLFGLTYGEQARIRNRDSIANYLNALMPHWNTQIDKAHYNQLQAT